MSIDTARLDRINELDGPCVYSLYDGQVVEAGEVVARAKIIPFAVSRDVLSDVECDLRRCRPVPFAFGRSARTASAAVVHESMGDRAVARFRDAVAEKIAWFGSTLGAVEVTPPDVDVDR